MLPFFREPFRASSLCFSAENMGKKLCPAPQLPGPAAWGGLVWAFPADLYFCSDPTACQAPDAGWTCITEVDSGSRKEEADPTLWEPQFLCQAAGLCLMSRNG